MRLNAFLARAGVASRRGADELIKAGRRDGERRRRVSSTRSSSRRTSCASTGASSASRRLRHVLLNKPRGTITTASDPSGRPTVVELVKGDVRVVPVGRLDRDTTGVLLLTNDGPLAHRLAHPRYGIEKTYVAEVRGEPSDETLAALADGVELDDGPTAPARVRRLAPVARRARAPRGAQPPGAPHARGGRPSGRAAPSLALRRAGPGPAAPGRLARADARRGAPAATLGGVVGAAATPRHLQTS